MRIDMSYEDKPNIEDVARNARSNSQEAMYYIQELDKRIAALELRNYVSYFLYRVEITTQSVCHNAKTNLCKKCCEPECELAKGKRE